MGVFSKMFGKYLLLTNTLSCGMMMAAGDLMQQRSDFLKKHLTKSTAANEQTTNVLSQHTKKLANSLDDELENLQSVVRIVAKNEAPVAANTADGYDWIRTRNMATVGLLQGPFHHYFYAVLEKFVPGRSAVSIVKKTLLDQSIASPTCLGIFFFGLGVMENRNLKEINSEVKLKLVDTWKVDCMFWPPTQFINFMLIPLQYRVMYINFMTMIYDMFLSYMKYDAEFE
ncbi:mpv17-like protein 2 [Nasonia vitripennis]|uniref:Mpv17-like protein 2 n=1 Tax=Nasonia vitripennis TaxID=7425 RepID=A0A7M7G2Y9_NASVI|nr:mpv17-like protein 2 [Nasonia vitripennis]